MLRPKEEVYFQSINVDHCSSSLFELMAKNEEEEKKDTIGYPHKN